MIYLLSFIISISALASPIDNAKPYLSQKAYEVWTNQKCQNISSSEISKLETATQCHMRTNKALQNAKLDSGEISENIFFNYAAKKQVDILNCQISKLNKLTGKSKDAQNFRQLIENDISEKIQDLRSLDRKIKELNEKNKSIETRLTRPDFLSSTEIESLIAEKKVTEKQLSDLTPHFNAIYHSIWSSSDPVMMKYLDQLISSDLPIKELSKKYSFNDEVLKGILTVSHRDLKTLNTHYDQKNQTYQLNQETKELIIKRGDAFQRLQELEKDPTAFSNLYCRLQARYGKGTDYLENGIAVGSLFLGGFGMVADLAAVGKLSRLGLALNARQSQVAMTTAEVLLASSTAISTFDTIQLLDKCSPQNSGTPTSFKADNCTASAVELTSFESQRLEQTNCVLDVALAAMPLAANYGFKIGGKAFSKIERRVGVSTSRSELRTAFVRANLEKNFATEQENLKWISMAEASSKGEQVNTRFVDVENSMMKTLNDTTKDKNFVTSLTNKNKEIIFNKIDELQKNNPGLEITKYSDFKSSRFAFSGRIPPDLDSQLKKAFLEANLEYTDFLKNENLVRASDSPENWFRAGLGSTADEATLAARYSRKSTGSNRMQIFSDSEVKSNLKSAMSESESLRKDIENDFQSASFMQKAPDTDKYILDESAIDVVRKSSTSEGAALALEKIYGTKVSPAQAETMKRYLKSIDEFSPGIHIGKRELANLTDATKGGISADFAGMGAANLAGTAKALAKTSDLKSAIRSARQEEKAVTREFLEKKNAFESKVNNYLVDKKQMHGTSVTCSGDDCVVVSAKNLDSKTKAELVQRLSKGENPAGMRVAFIGDQITDGGMRNTLASHGEAIDKILRKNLRGEIPQDVLGKVLFSVDVRASELGQGEMKLFIGNSRVKLTSEQQSAIKNAFDKSVKDFNEVLKEDKSVGSYSTVQTDD